MEVDYENGNCYKYGGFGHITRHYRNQRIEGRIGQGIKLEYRNSGNNEERRMIKGGNGQNNNLNGDRDLIVLDFFLINNLLHSVRGQTMVATFVTTYRRCTLT